MLDLLDVFVEADRLVDFTRFFTHSGTKEVRSRDALRPLLILDLFAEGTNTGIQRVATANDQYGYDELLYVREDYFSRGGPAQRQWRGRQQAPRPAQSAAVGGRREQLCLGWQRALKAGSRIS